MSLKLKGEREPQALERRRERRNSPRRREVRGLTACEDGQRVEQERVTVTSDAEADARMLIATVAPTYAATVAFYGARGESREAAIEQAKDLESYMAEQARTCPPNEQSWDRLGALAKVDLVAANEAWLTVQEFAHDELESGVRSAEVTGNSSPLERARCIALRQKFAEEWGPRGGIEAALVDTLAQCYMLYLYWTEISHKRAVEECDSMKRELERYETMGWKPPYQTRADAVEQAHQMADRYNRMFLRTLRQMRDLRRYAPPVFVNNGGQVNVAAEGGQQVNIT